MIHVAFLIHLFTLLSGIITAVLGLLLYLKYKIKAIRHYSIFIFSTNLTVALTALKGYIIANSNLFDSDSVQIAEILLFDIFLILINYSFSSFARSIINKRFTKTSIVFFAIPCLLFILSVIAGIYYLSVNIKTPYPSVIEVLYILIILFLFLSFLSYSILIALNNKKINNPDLKRALMILAVIFIVYIPFPDRHNYGVLL